MRAPVMEPRLASLLDAVGEKDFFERYWERRHLHAPATADRLASLKDAFGGFSVSDLLALRAGDVVVAPQSVGKAQCGMRVTDLDDAHAWFDAGRTLTFNLDPAHPAVRPWYDAFTGSLAPSPNRSVVTVFCTPPGHGTSLHFDQYDVFNIALSGTKRWRIGRDRAVRAPLHDWQVQQPVPVELRGYWPSASDPEADLQTIEMTPGDMLYLPRGYLHETLAEDEPTVGMSFVVDVQSTFELINVALRVLMLKDADLRASANDLWHERRKNAAATSLEDGLAKVQSILASIEPADLRPPEDAIDIGAETPLRRSPLGVRIEEGDTIILRRVDQIDGAEIERRDVGVVDWIDAREGAFSAAEMFSPFDGAYSEAVLRDLAGMLVETGYLTRA